MSKRGKLAIYSSFLITICTILLHQIYTHSPLSDTLSARFPIVLSSQKLDGDIDNNIDNFKFTDSHICFLRKILSDDFLSIETQIVDALNIQSEIQLPDDSHINFGKPINFERIMGVGDRKVLFINKNALISDNLEHISETINWSKINYNNRVPVILGNSYRNKVDIGDTFKVNVQSLDAYLDLQVIGYINPNHRIYHDGNPSLNLDGFILIPLPSVLTIDNFQNDQQFRIVADGILNSKLLSKEMKSDDFIRSYLSTYANECALSDYEIGGYELFHEINFNQMIDLKKRYTFSYFTILLLTFGAILYALHEYSTSI